MGTGGLEPGAQSVPVLLGRLRWRVDVGAAAVVILVAVDEVREQLTWGRRCPRRCPRRPHREFG